MSRWARIAVRVVLGAIIGVITLEVALRAFVTPGALPMPNIRLDSFDDPAIEWRQMEEGVATSHFTVHGARLTGNAPAREGNTAVVIGDSYVVADQVADRYTMGSRLEARAREHGVPLDVRQYGWLGASPAQYLYVADDIMRRWQPSRVFVVVSPNDFDRSALILAAPRFRVDTSGALRILGERMPEIEMARGGSAMLKAMRHRWYVLHGRMLRRAVAKEGRAIPATQAVAATPAEAPPDSLEYERAPAAVVRELSAAYGRALTVIYLAEPGLRVDTMPDRAETLLLQACAATGVDCASTRSQMVAASRDGRISHGLGITRIGNGHLNPGGHEIAGRLMWERLTQSRIVARDEP